MDNKDENSIGEMIVLIWAFLGGAPWIMALMKVAMNAITWLKEGVWPEQSTANYLETWGIIHEPFDLVGLEKIAQWFLNTSAITGLTVIGFVTAFVFGTVLEIAEKRRQA